MKPADFLNARRAKILERAETTGDGPTQSGRSGPCNVVLRPFRTSSLGQRVQPATMIGFQNGSSSFTITDNVWRTQAAEFKGLEILVTDRAPCEARIMLGS